MRYLLSSAVIALTLCPVSSATADEVTLVAPGGIRAAIEKMIPDFEKKTGHKVKPTFGSGGGTKQQVARAARRIERRHPAGGAAAGVSFEKTLEKLGIAGQMKPKLKLAQGGAGAMAAVAKGEVDIGLTFLSEITDPGVDAVGPLPREISTPTGLVGFLSTHAKAPEAAKALLKYLSSSDAAKVYKALGMQPGR